MNDFRETCSLHGLRFNALFAEWTQGMPLNKQGDAAVGQPAASSRPLCSITTSLLPSGLW